MIRESGPRQSQSRAEQPASPPILPPPCPAHRRAADRTVAEAALSLLADAQECLAADVLRNPGRISEAFRLIQRATTLLRTIELLTPIPEDQPK